MRYIADSTISFSVSIKGKDKRVRFNPVMDGGSAYVTNEPAEIATLEALSSFKRGVFRRAPGSKDEAVGNAGKSSNAGKGNAGKGKGGTSKKGSDVVGATPVETVTTWQEAAEYLSKEFEVGADQLTTPENILALSAEKGITFPNIG